MKNKSNIAKVALTVGLLVGTGAAAFGVTSVANAATSSQGKAAKILKKKAAKKSTASNKSTASAQAVTSTTVPAVPQSIGGEADGMGHRGGPINLDNVAKVLGITTTELQTELQTKSFATIAKEKNVDIQKVKDQLLKDFTDKEQAEVAAGEHTQAEVDAKITQFTANLDTIVNTVRPAHGPGMGHRGGPINLDNVAKVLGITTAELQTELQTKSFATIAKEKNVDIQKVKDQLLKDFTDKEQAEVAEGKHTQAEVDAKITQFKANLDTIVNTVRPAHGPGMGKGGPGGRIASEGVAKALGLTTTELQTQLQSGKTLADIAKDKNVDIQKVKDAITADVKAHLDEEVASGEHTQAEADAKLAELKTRLDDIVNGVRPAGGPGMGGRGHHGGRGGHGHGMGDENGMPGMPGSMQSSVQGASFSA